MISLDEIVNPGRKDADAKAHLPFLNPSGWSGESEWRGHLIRADDE